MLSETQEAYTDRHPDPGCGINPVLPKPRPPVGQEYVGILCVANRVWAPWVPRAGFREPGPLSPIWGPWRHAVNACIQDEQDDFRFDSMRKGLSDEVVVAEILED